MGDQTIKTISIITALIGLVVVILYLFLGRSRPLLVKTLKVASANVQVEIAESLLDQERGLSGRANLAPDSGMLFIYNNKGIRYFWMPKMNFALDVLWIADGMVAGLQENIPYQSPDGSIPRFQSNVPVDMVLEVNSGWIAQNKAKIGDKVDIN